MEEEREEDAVGQSEGVDEGVADTLKEALGLLVVELLWQLLVCALWLGYDVGVPPGVSVAGTLGVGTAVRVPLLQPVAEGDSDRVGETEAQADGEAVLTCEALGDGQGEATPVGLTDGLPEVEGVIVGVAVAPAAPEGVTVCELLALALPLTGVADVVDEAAGDAVKAVALAHPEAETVLVGRLPVGEARGERDPLSLPSAVPVGKPPVFVTEGEAWGEGVLEKEAKALPEKESVALTLEDAQPVKVPGQPVGETLRVA